MAPRLEGARDGVVRRRPDGYGGSPAPSAPNLTGLVSGRGLFEIQRSVNGGAFTALTTVGANVVTYSDNTTAADTDYAYRVRACDASACSAFSNTATATTPPTAPTGLTATAISSTQIDLAWTDASVTETEFRIERRPSGGSFAQIDTVGTDVASYTDTTGLVAATTYEYQIRACNAGGCSAYTAIASATTP